MLYRLLAKCILAVAGKESKLACGAEQVCAGTEGGIEGAIHAAKALVDQHRLEEDWGFLIVDAPKLFNEGNCTAMLWTVRRETQGESLAMVLYQLGLLLLIRALARKLPGAR